EGMLRLAEGVAERLSRLSAELLDVVDDSLARAARRADLVPVRQVGLRMAALTEQLRGYVGQRGGGGARTNLSSLVLELSPRLEAALHPAASLSSCSVS